MTQRRTLSILSFLLVILVTTCLYAQPCDPAGPRPCSSPGPLPPAPPPQHGMPHSLHAPGMPGLHHPIWDDLAAVGLDAKQKQALDGIRNGVTKSVIRKTADLRIARIETHEALAGDTVNIKTVEEKVRTAAALRADIELSVIRAIEEAKALLTPAQRTRLNELRKAGGMPGSAHVRPPARPGKKDGPAARAEKG